MVDVVVGQRKSPLSTAGRGLMGEVWYLGMLIEVQRSIEIGTKSEALLR